MPAGKIIVKNILDDILTHVVNDDYAFVTKIIDDVLVKVEKEIARKKHSGDRVSEVTMLLRNCFVCQHLGSVLSAIRSQ